MTESSTQSQFDAALFLDMVEAVFSLRRWEIPGTRKVYRPTRWQRYYAMSVAETLVASVTQDRIQEVHAEGKLEKTRKLTAIRAIEADTGTGKTIAYLVVLLLFAAMTGKRCGISVYTLDLQNQIYGIDAIRAQRQPDVAAGDFSDLAIARYLVGQALNERGMLERGLPHVGFRRGAANYLSVTKALDLCQTLPPALAQRDDWVAFQDRTMQIKAWKPYQTDLFGENLGFGLLDYIDLPAGLARARVAVESTQENHGNPIYQAILAHSRAGDVVIFTHAMAIANAERWHALLEHGSDQDDLDDSGDNLLRRPLSVVLYDEADLLEGAAQSFGHRWLDAKIIANRLLSWQRDGIIPAGLRPTLNALLEEAEQAIYRFFNKVYKETGGPAYEKREEAEDDAEPFRVFLYGKHAHYLADATGRIKALNEAIKACLDAMNQGKCHEVPAAIRSTLVNWHHTSTFLHETAQRHMDKARKQADAHKKSAAGEGDLENEAAKKVYLDAALTLSWSPTRHYPSFETIETYPARRIAHHWALSFNGERQAHMDAVIFTSATLLSLSAKDPMADMRSIFGIWDNKDHIHEIPHDTFSPDRYGSLKAVYLPHPSAPYPLYRKDKDDQVDEGDNPTTVMRLDDDYLDYLAAAIRWIAATGEPALVIPSSYRETRDLAQRLEAEDRVYIHRARGHEALRAGVRALQEGTHTVLISPAAGQGTNIRAVDGTQLLRHVVITKLPLPKLDSAREEILAINRQIGGLSAEKARKSAHGEMLGIQYRQGYFVLKQRLGRLIRSAQDKDGCLWVLDPRLGLPEGAAGLDPVLRKALQSNPRATGRYARYYAAFPARFSEVVRHPVLVVPVIAKKDGKPCITTIATVATTAPAILAG